MAAFPLAESSEGFSRPGSEEVCEGVTKALQTDARFKACWRGVGDLGRRRDGLQPYCLD